MTAAEQAHRQGGDSVAEDPPAPGPEKPAPGLQSLYAGLEGVDELSAQVFRAFLETLRLHRHLMFDTLAAQGAHPGQALCLRLVAAHDGVTQRDLADVLHLARPTVSKMLRAMEKAGTVRRRADAADRRLTRVYLTDHGRAIECDLRAAAAAYVNATIGTLSEDDRGELVRLLGALGGSIEHAIAARRAPVAGRPDAGAPGGVGAAVGHGPAGATDAGRAP